MFVHRVPLGEAERVGAAERREQKCDLSSACSRSAWEDAGGAGGAGHRAGAGWGTGNLLGDRGGTAAPQGVWAELMESSRHAGGWEKGDPSQHRH